MPRALDLIGQRFGRLVLIRLTESRNNARYWETKCDCGAKKIIRQLSMTQGRTTSCGCFQRENASRIASISMKNRVANDGHIGKKHTNLIGKNYGRLTVNEFHSSQMIGGRFRVFWACLCSCGSHTVAQASRLVGGITKSCGCLQYETRVSNVEKNRKYRIANKLPEQERARRAKVRSANYRKKHLEYLRQKSRDWCATQRRLNPENIKRKKRDAYLANPDKFRKISRENFSRARAACLDRYIRAILVRKSPLRSAHIPETLIEAKRIYLRDYFRPTREFGKLIKTLEKEKQHGK